MNKAVDKKKKKREAHDVYPGDIILFPPTHKVNSVTFDLTSPSCGCHGLRNAPVPSSITQRQGKQRPREEMQRRLPRLYGTAAFWFLGLRCLFVSGSECESVCAFCGLCVVLN